MDFSKEVTTKIWNAYRKVVAGTSTDEESLNEETSKEKLDRLSKKMKDKADSKAQTRKTLDNLRKGKGKIDYLRKVEEKKLDSVDDKENDKKFKNRDDKDIDNDGDVDSSDEYLHKRRKAISNKVKKEKGYSNDEDVVESSDLEEKRSKEDAANHPPQKKDHTILVVKDKKVSRVPKKDWPKYQKMGYGLAEETESVTEETVSIDEPIQQKRLGMRDAILAVWEGKTYAERTKGATNKEGILDKESGKSKQFVDQHTIDDEDKGLKKGFADVDKAGSAATKQAPSRRGDQLDNGDKKPFR